MKEDAPITDFNHYGAMIEHVGILSKIQQHSLNEKYNIDKQHKRICSHLSESERCEFNFMCVALKLQLLHS